MSQPYIGEVKFVAFNFAPRGFAACNGQLLPIAQNQALFSILGTTYGGDGRVTFGLPNLQGRVPAHWGQGAGLPQVALGEQAGEINHTLTVNEMAAHNHILTASNQGLSQNTPVGNFLASPNTGAYASSANTTMISNEVGQGGGGQAHNNMQPYLVLNAIIALQGIFPPRN